ncbi:MAG: hypothetical protein ACTSYD_07910 [Candidatus Heimdallarchaeaceae archaeon]
MKLLKQLLIAILFVSTVLTVKSMGYIPENAIVFDQIPLQGEVVQNSTLEVAIIIKNYLNYTITNIQISLNLTEARELYISSCEFGVLQGQENVTLNSTIQTSSEYGFTSVNVTYGLMTKRYLSFNISAIPEGTKMVFKYNVTSPEDGNYIIPRAKMVYYDNWGDEQTISSATQLQIHFKPATEEKDPYLPDWEGKIELTNATAWIIYIAVPLVAVILASTLASIRLGKK